MAFVLGCLLKGGFDMFRDGNMFRGVTSFVLSNYNVQCKNILFFSIELKPLIVFKRIIFIRLLFIDNPFIADYRFGVGRNIFGRIGFAERFIFLRFLLADAAFNL